MSARRHAVLRLGRLALVLFVAMAPGAVSAGSVPETGVHEQRLKGAEHLVAVVPARVVDYAIVRGDGRSEIFLLTQELPPVDREPRPVDDDDDDEDRSTEAVPPCPGQEQTAGTAPRSPAALFRFDTGDRELISVRQDLPSDVTAIDAFDVDADGREDLVLRRPGGLYRLPERTDQPPIPLLEGGGRGRPAIHARFERSSVDGSPVVSTTTPGWLALYGPSEPGGPWGERVRIELPREARLSDTGIRVWSSTPSSIGRASDGTRYFATPPDDSSVSRVKTTLVKSVPDGEATTIDCWARLPQPEDVLQSDFLMLDDRPVLMVLTKPANKLGLFGEQRLRLYWLERDRSRLGLLPLFATETRMNLWQDGRPWLLDADGDGRRDLIFGYWKGILNDRVVLDVYLRDSEGGFKSSTRSTVRDVSKGDRSFVQYGSDLDGDGLPDLVVRGKAGLLVYRGRRSKGGGELVEQRPLPLRVFADKKKDRGDTGLLLAGGSSARPHLVDLDGDGVDEILLLERGSTERAARFHVLRVDRDQR